MKIDHVRSNFPLNHLGLGLLIRELVAPWTGHPYDFEIWVRLGYYMQNLSNPYGRLPYVPGLSASPYNTVGSISYPPFSAFIFALAYKFYALLGEPSKYLYYFILKQPMILADIGVAVVLARILLRSGNTGSARFALLAWLYFPLGIIFSSVWGQVDPISLFLTLVAVYYFLSARWLPSAVTLGLAIYMKTLPVLFLPVLLLHSPKTMNRLKYSLVSLIVPSIGTLLPVWAFSWGFRGLFNNASFQIAIPTTGDMSLLGQVHLLPSLLAIVNPFTGFIWIPVLIATYLYVWKRNVQLVPALVFAILSFSISRPFLPEQWSIYPAALLLLSLSEISHEHFLSLSSVATGFVVVSNTLMVRFFTPISVGAYNWDYYINNYSPYALLRTSLVVLLALIYFIEATMIITGRRSAIYRLVAAVLPNSLLQDRRFRSQQVGVT